SGAAVLKGAPLGAEVEPAAARATAPASSQAQQPEPTVSTPADTAGQQQGEDEATKARREAWQAYYAQLAQLQKERLAAAQSALTAETGLGAGGNAPAAAPGAGPEAALGLPPAVIPPGALAAAGGFPGAYGMPSVPPAGPDLNAQREKQAFLSKPGDVTGASDDLPATLREPVPYTVTAGTV